MKLSYKLSSFLHISQFISVSLFLSLSQGFAMTSDDDWDTDPEPSQNKQKSINSSSKRNSFQRTLIANLQGTAPIKTPTQVGKIKVPQSLKTYFGERAEDKQELFIEVPQRPQEENKEVIESNNNTQPSLGVSKTEEEVQSSREENSPFQQKMQDQELRENTLKSLGIAVNEDTLASYFLDPRELSERLVSNFHGPILLHEFADFRELRSFPILDALRYTKSVKILSLKNAIFKTDSYLALATALAHNHSLKRLDLTDVSWTPEALFILGAGLQNKKNLQEIILRPKTVFTIFDIENFYRLIETNRGLRIIVWPEKNEILAKIDALAPINAPAALHRGVMYAEGIMEKQDEKKALTYLQLAHKLGHPLASYEIGRLKEKQKEYGDALEWYKKAASQIHVKALVKVGDYARGIWPKGSQKVPEYKEAHLHYNQAARLGNAKALYRLGRMHEAGRYVEKSLVLAAHYFYQAIEWGYPDAFTALGALYQNPDYVGSGDSETNLKTAEYYFKWGKRFPKTAGTSDKWLQLLLKTINKGPSK